MSKNLDSPTKLTEFAPLSPEEKKVGVGYIFSKIFKRGPEGSEASPRSSPSPEDGAAASSTTVGSILSHPRVETATNSNVPEWASEDTISNHSSSRDSTASHHPTNLPFTIYSDMSSERSLANVLKRISNMLAMKRSGKDTDIKLYWMPDSVSKECYDCGQRFTTFRRRHHCRVCGQIFCSRCCGQEIPGKIMGCTGNLRVCVYCCKVVLSYLQSADMGADLSADLRAVQEDLQSKYGENSVPLPPPHMTLVVPVSSNLQSPNEGMRSDQRSGTLRRDSRRKQSYQEDRFALGRSGGLSSPSAYLTSEEQQLSMEERWQALQCSSSLRALWEEMRNPETGLCLQSHKYRLRSFPACFVGTQLVDWMLAQNRAATMVQAVSLGQALIDGGYMECISHPEPTFHDGYAVYRLRSTPAGNTRELTSSPTSPASDLLWAKPPDVTDLASTDSESDMCHPVANASKDHDTASIPSSSSTFYLDLDVQENRVQLRRPPDTPRASTVAAVSRKSSVISEHQVSQSEELDEIVTGEDVHLKPHVSQQEMNNTGISREFLTRTLLVEGSQTREMVPSMGWHHVQHLRTDNGEKEAYTRLTEAFEQHERTLIQQLLSSESLSQSWCDIVGGLTHQIVDLVRPDVRNDADDMDIRQYVQFKKVSGGSRSESCVVSGVVCTKNVAHRSMSTRLTNPHILLLGCSIIYERVEGRFLSMEPLIMQEQDYLKNVVARIESLKPDLVIVERTVSRLAQDMLLERGITVVLNVKSAVLERLARLTQADILPCIDAHVGKPRLGMCHNFYLKVFKLDVCSASKLKTLMFFDGCATHLGCTTILRGGTMDELRRLKKVLQHMIMVNYSWKMEKSFLMDEFAMPPSAPIDSFFADEDESLKDAPESDDTSKRVLEEKGTKETCDSKLTREKEKDDGAGDRRRLRWRSVSREKGGSSSSIGEDKKTEAVVDQSDPLHQYLADGEPLAGVTEPEENSQDAGGGLLAVATLPLANRFRKALDGTVLSSSPYLQFTVPFLETDAGRACQLRRFFPQEVFWSRQFDNPETETDIVTGVSSKTEEKPLEKAEEIFVQPYHPFVHSRLTKCAESWEVQALLSSFRATGGRLLHPEERQVQETMSSVPAPPSTRHQTDGTPLLADIHPHWPQPNRVECLDPMNHQKLTVLFCSFAHESNNAPAFCVNPWVVLMELYGRNDIPLGQFLQHYCFRKSYACPSPSCGTPMMNHIRRFVHESGCVQVTLKELDSEIPVQGNGILMWSWCQTCKLVSPVVPMSVDTWSLSFAKYLELRFHGHMYQRRGKDQPCSHSLHHDNYQYFGYKDVVVAFKYNKVAQWEISLPPPTVVRNKIAMMAQQVKSQKSAIEEVKQLAWEGYEVFSFVLEKLCTLGNETEPGKQELLSNLKSQLKRDNANFKSKIEEIQLKLTSPTLEALKLDIPLTAEGSSDAGITDASSGPNYRAAATVVNSGEQRLWDVEDCLVQLKRMIAEAVATWNSRVVELTKKRDEKNKKSGDSHKNITTNSSSDALVLGGTEEINNELSLSSSRRLSLGDPDANLNASDPNFMFAQISSSDADLVTSKEDAEGNLLSSSDTELWFSSSEHKKGGTNAEVAEDYTCAEEMVRGHERSHSEGDGRTSSTLPEDRSERRSIPQVPPTATVKQIFSQLLPSNSSASIVPNPLNTQDHYLLPRTVGPEIVVYESEPSSIIAYGLCSTDYHARLAELRQPSYSNIADGPPPSPIELKRKLQLDSSCSESVESSTSVGKRGMLSFLRGGSPNLSASRVNSSTPLHVANNSADYEGVQYTAVGTASTGEDEQGAGDAVGLAGDTGKSKSTWTSSGPNLAVSEANIDVHFSDSNMAFHCRVYLAEQFVLLRALVCQEGEESYARTLARCVRWAARGGKSGSAFCKTKDDRYVLKEMSQHEVQLFLEIAPNYLTYLRRALEGGQPTLLGKIVGVYRVGCRSLSGATSMKTNFLVMENLFYGRNVTQRFDLKGSMRNRLVEPTMSAQGGEIVLLDENLLKMTCDSPLYIQPHSKLVLTLAIEKDTQFLSSQAVMDYSLLVGLDEERHELVLGIIDYIRTFTWDKKLETMVKSSGFLGGQGKLPTIVSPELYQSRFMQAMHRYFLPVPDRWTGLGRGVDC